jgi:hypothetical protein
VGERGSGDEGTAEEEEVDGSDGGGRLIDGIHCELVCVVVDGLAGWCVGALVGCWLLVYVRWDEHADDGMGMA